MLDFEPNGVFTPTTADRAMLLSMDKNDVYIVQWPSPGVPWEFYRNMLPDVPVVLCHESNHFFHEEDWEVRGLASTPRPPGSRRRVGS